MTDYSALAYSLPENVMMYKYSGRTEDEVLNGAWPPSGEMMKNLGITEHLRWCAFHYVSGYRTMPPEVYEERAEISLSSSVGAFALQRSPQETRTL